LKYAQNNNKSINYKFSKSFVHEFRYTVRVLFPSGAWGQEQLLEFGNKTNLLEYESLLSPELDSGLLPV